MNNTPRTDAAFKESIQWDFPADYMRGKMEEMERELSSAIIERDDLRKGLNEVVERHTSRENFHHPMH